MLSTVAIKRLCKCDMCQKHLSLGKPRWKRHGSSYARFDEVIIDELHTTEGKCDFCKSKDRYIAFYTHPVISEFLKVSWLCWECQDICNQFILQKHKLCLMTATDIEIELALLDMVAHCLEGEILLAQGKSFSMKNRWVQLHGWGTEVNEMYYKRTHPDEVEVDWGTI